MLSVDTQVESLLHEFYGVDEAGGQSEAPVPDKITRTYADGKVRGEKLTVTLCNKVPPVIMLRQNGNCAVIMGGGVGIVVLLIPKDDTSKEPTWSPTKTTDATRKGALKTAGAHPIRRDARRHRAPFGVFGDVRRD